MTPCEGVAAPVGASVKQRVVLIMHRSGGGPPRGLRKMMWEGDAVCATDTQADARSTRRCVIGLHRSGGVGCAVALAWTSEREALPGTDGQSRFVGGPRKRVLSAPRDNTWSHVLHAGASPEDSSLIPIWGSGRGGRCTTRSLRHHDLDQSRSVTGTALWVRSLRPRGAR